MKRLELRVEGESFRGKRFAVLEGGLRLGRSSSNDIVIHDEELSRNHCLFEPIGEFGVRITDLASANGTFVNERRLGAESVELKVNDVIRIGQSFITVVDPDHIGEVKPDIDLGLGGAAEKGDPGETAKGREAPKRKPLMNVLWGGAIVVLGAAIWLMLQTPETPVAKVAELVEAKNVSLVEMRYEKVVADSSSIFRYAMALSPDGTLHVAIDDLLGDGRHINRREKLKSAARSQLAEILADEALASLDRSYAGQEEEPPKLNSWRLVFETTRDRKEIKIVNTQEPEPFRRVREKLETFAMNELGIRALQYSREKLLEMAHAAADTGRMKWEDREVEYGNLYASMRAYREAISDLETVNPRPPEYAEYREALDRATKELDKRYQDQRFVAEQATSVGDWAKAKQELRVLCEMVPDREDDRNREASLKLIDVEKRLGKKGGRK